MSHHNHLLTIDGSSGKAFAVVHMEFSGPDNDEPNVFDIHRPDLNRDLLEMPGVERGTVDDVADNIIETFLRETD